VQKGTVICAFVNDCLDGECLRNLKTREVQLVALRCAGFNQVDLKEAAKLDLKVVRVPAYSPHAIAEHSLALLLTLNRKIHRAYNRVREHNFSLDGLVGFDLFKKRVGVVGTGKIGKIAAQIFRGFGAEVHAYDPFPDNEWAAQHQVTYTSLDPLLEQSNVISLYLPLTTDTFHLFGPDHFKKMKPGAFLVNTSRGKLIDTKALIHALKSGKLGGVALDVYEEEEGVFFEDLSNEMLEDDDLSRLLTFPNVLITAHQAFLTAEALSGISNSTTENIRRFLKQESFLPGTELTTNE
jgi:D-lactate dehydrogenase